MILRCFGGSSRQKMQQKQCEDDESGYPETHPGPGAFSLRSRTSDVKVAEVAEVASGRHLDLAIGRAICSSKSWGLSRPMAGPVAAEGSPRLKKKITTRSLRCHGNVMVFGHIRCSSLHDFFGQESAPKKDSGASLRNITQKRSGV